MSKIDDGRPAFPYDATAVGSERGMTLLDWFAGEALASLVDATFEEAFAESSGGACDVTANTAYALAAAMIREKRRLEQEASDA